MYVYAYQEAISSPEDGEHGKNPNLWENPLGLLAESCCRGPGIFYCLPSHGVVVQFFLLAVMVSGSRSIVLSWCRGSGVFSGMGLPPYLRGSGGLGGRVRLVKWF